jgi:transcription initiation factor TFIID subunit 10
MEDEPKEFKGLEESEKKILEILSLMEDHKPLIAEELIDYYLIKAGVRCEDIRLKRLISVLGQKFLSDVINDALKYSKLKNSTHGSSVRSSTQRESSKQSLSMDDLIYSLSERGIIIKRPPYHQ